MQHGIYYAYWEHERNGDYQYYIKKAADLGFDILEIAAGPLPDYSEQQLKDLKNCAEEAGIRLTVGYGPAPENNIASPDAAVRAHALECLNRFENHVLNTAKEGVDFVKAIHQLEPAAKNAHEYSHSILNHLDNNNNIESEDNYIYIIIKVNCRNLKQTLMQSVF